jgi:hypothetical protein
MQIVPPVSAWRCSDAFRPDDARYPEVKVRCGLVPRNASLCLLIDFHLRRTLKFYRCSYCQPP